MQAAPPCHHRDSLQPLWFPPVSTHLATLRLGGLSTSLTLWLASSTATPLSAEPRLNRPPHRARAGVRQRNALAPPGGNVGGDDRLEHRPAVLARRPRELLPPHAAREVLHFLREAVV